jgi:hypothetical protein
MAKHNVYISIPIKEMGKVDAVFHLYRDELKLGRITISKGENQ